MENKRQRKSNCTLTKGSKMNLHHFGLILQLRIIPSCQKPPLYVYFQWYFWNTLSAQCKIQLAQLLFYFFSIKKFLVIRIPGTAFKIKIFSWLPQDLTGITQCPQCWLAKVVLCNNGKCIQVCYFWREAAKECFTGDTLLFWDDLGTQISLRHSQILQICKSGGGNVLVQTFNIYRK